MNYNKRETKPNDSIWPTPDGKWCYKNPAGGYQRVSTEEEALHSRKVWQPQWSRLIKDGIIKRGDLMSLKLYAVPQPFELQIEGVRNKTPVFLVKGTSRSLGEIKQFVAEKLKKSDGASVSVNYDQTIHIPSGKSLNALKKDYVHKARQENKNEESFDFSNVFLFEAQQKTKETKANNELQKTHFLNFKADFKKYEEAQFNIMSEMQTLSEEKRIECYRDSLIMFLSTTKINE
jgi:hypothetical protein